MTNAINCRETKLKVRLTALVNQSRQSSIPANQNYPYMLYSETACNVS